MASYLYYVEDKCLFSDAYYDQLCKTLHKKLDKIDHRHKHLVDKAALKAGTGFHLKQDDYPTITKNSARSLLKHFGEHK
jgi:NAD-dependent DNA ligase